MTENYPKMNEESLKQDEKEKKEDSKNIEIFWDDIPKVIVDGNKRLMRSQELSRMLSMIIPTQSDFFLSSSKGEKIEVGDWIFVTGYLKPLFLIYLKASMPISKNPLVAIFFSGLNEKDFKFIQNTKLFLDMRNASIEGKDITKVETYWKDNFIPFAEEYIYFLKTKWQNMEPSQILPFSDVQSQTLEILSVMNKKDFTLLEPLVDSILKKWRAIPLVPQIFPASGIGSLSREDYLRQKFEEKTLPLRITFSQEAIYPPSIIPKGKTYVKFNVFYSEKSNRYELDHSFGRVINKDELGQLSPEAYMFQVIKLYLRVINELPSSISLDFHNPKEDIIVIGEPELEVTPIPQVPLQATPTPRKRPITKAKMQVPQMKGVLTTLFKKVNAKEDFISGLEINLINKILSTEFRNADELQKFVNDEANSSQLKVIVEVLLSQKDPASIKLEMKDETLFTSFHEEFEQIKKVITKDGKSDGLTPEEKLRFLNELNAFTEFITPKMKSLGEENQREIKKKLEEMRLYIETGGEPEKKQTHPSPFTPEIEQKISQELSKVIGNIALTEEQTEKLKKQTEKLKELTKRLKEQSQKLKESSHSESNVDYKIVFALEEEIQQLKKEIKNFYEEISKTIAQLKKSEIKTKTKDIEMEKSKTQTKKKVAVGKVRKSVNITPALVKTFQENAKAQGLEITEELVNDFINSLIKTAPPKKKAEIKKSTLRAKLMQLVGKPALAKNEKDGKLEQCKFSCDEHKVCFPSKEAMEKHMNNPKLHSPVKGQKKKLDASKAKINWNLAEIKKQGFQLLKGIPAKIIEKSDSEYYKAGDYGIPVNFEVYFDDQVHFKQELSEWTQKFQDELVEIFSTPETAHFYLKFEDIDLQIPIEESYITLAGRILVIAPKEDFEENEFDRWDFEKDCERKIAEKIELGADWIKASLLAYVIRKSDISGHYISEYETEIAFINHSKVEIEQKKANLQKAWEKYKEIKDESEMELYNETHPEDEDDEDSNVSPMFRLDAKVKDAKKQKEEKSSPKKD